MEGRADERTDGCAYNDKSICPLHLNSRQENDYNKNTCYIQQTFSGSKAFCYLMFTTSLMWCNTMNKFDTL